MTQQEVDAAAYVGDEMLAAGAKEIFASGPIKSEAEAVAVAARVYIIMEATRMFLQQQFETPRAERKDLH